MNVLIVDGYNVVHAWPRLKRVLREQGLEDARRRLVQILGEYAAQTGAQVTLVFDAHARARTREEPEVIDGVTVLYGTKTSSADHVIERLAADAARRGDAADVAVATGDRLQRDMVGAMGVPTLSPPALEVEVDRVAAARASGSRKRGPEAADARRIEHHLDPLVRRRLEALRRGESGPVP